MNLLVGILLAIILIIAINCFGKLVQFVLGILLIAWIIYYFNLIYYFQQALMWLQYIIS